MAAMGRASLRNVVGLEGTREVNRGVSAQEASIAVATVELRVVTVNGKQMTQSVFRQLPEIDFCHYGKAFVGSAPTALEYFKPDPSYGFFDVVIPVPKPSEVWGWVNHCPHTPKCGGLHVVLVEGGKLCRFTYHHTWTDNWTAHYRAECGQGLIEQRRCEEAIAMVAWAAEQYQFHLEHTEQLYIAV